MVSANSSDHHPGAALHRHRLVDDMHVAGLDREGHDRRRHQPVDQRRQEDRVELEELHLLGLPDHQRGDVAERAERAAGIGRDDQVDRRERRRSRGRGSTVPTASTTLTSASAVVRLSRNGDSTKAAAPVAQKIDRCDSPASQHPEADRLEDVALLHGDHIGHRGDQEEGQLADLDDRVVEARHSSPRSAPDRPAGGRRWPRTSRSRRRRSAPGSTSSARASRPRPRRHRR